MDHVLDNPAWNALISGNKNLSNGEDSVKCFAKEVSPFVGLKESSAKNFNILLELVPDESFSGFISPHEIEIPGQWKVLHHIPCLQMVYTGTENLTGDEEALVTLTEKDVPQMLALTQLTTPGPFGARTIDFGHYRGIFDGEQLVAMAGQRMNPLPYAEISAVCTHPDHIGKGYARKLLQHHIQRIKAASNIPFLHVREDNERAIKVYRDTGFSTRRVIYFYIIRKADK